MSKKIRIYIITIVIIILGIILFWQLASRSINIVNPEISEELKNKELKEKQAEVSESANKGQPSFITGLKCENYNRRPIAVMLANDPVTRPLSGISFADLVIEMPVITNSITRLMAVYVCESPKEIGSVRSARHDYIPLAMGLDAIFAHWGGSHFALDKLNAGIMDNINALKNPYNAYWQDWSKPMPHNGFTSYSRLFNAAQKLGYRLVNKFEGYPHLENPKPKIETKARLFIGYVGNYEVYYEYDPETNSYKRWRAGIPEIDKLNNKQIEVQNVVVMRAASRMIQPPDYNDVDVEGMGTAIVYRNGEEVKGTWKKQGKYQPTKLYFFDNKGKEIKFVPGKIWIEIVEPYTEVNWIKF